MWATAVLQTAVDDQAAAFTALLQPMQGRQPMRGAGLCEGVAALRVLHRRLAAQPSLLQGSQLHSFHQQTPAIV